jgi:hypothetical protein
MNAAVRELDLHGHTVSYRTAGTGPVLVLLHGMAASSATWDGVIPLRRLLRGSARQSLRHFQSRSGSEPKVYARVCRHEARLPWARPPLLVQVDHVGADRSLVPK